MMSGFGVNQDFKSLSVDPGTFDNIILGQPLLQPHTDRLGWEFIREFDCRGQ